MNFPVKVLLVVMLYSALALALEGQLLQNQVFKSKVLGQDVLYNTYLPPEYDAATEYPVLFYLHWFGGDNNSLNDFAGQTDKLIAEKQFPEIIIITPNAQRTWYLDDYKGRHKYATMFIDEFLPAIQIQFSLSPDPCKRAVMGASMGGFGALRFTMLFPDQFGICISFMGGISTKDQIVQDSDADYKLYHQNLYGEDLKGAERVNDYFVNNNPLYIAQKTDPNILKKVKWYIQTCDDDYHSLPNAELHAVFHRAGVAHEFRVNDGGHDGACTDSSLPDALEFLKRALESGK